MSPKSWAERACRAHAGRREDAQKPWGPEGLEMREKVGAGDRRCGVTGRCGGDRLEAQGESRARSCQEQTKVKEEQSEAASGLPHAEGWGPTNAAMGGWGLGAT